MGALARHHMFDPSAEASLWKVSVRTEVHDKGPVHRQGRISLGRVRRCGAPSRPRPSACIWARHMRGTV